VNVDVAVIRSNGFTDPVSFSVSGLPAQATAVFTPSSSVTRSTLNITAGQGIVPGDYPLTVTGTSASAGLAHSSNLVLTVLGDPNFSVLAAPDTMSVPAGANATYNLAVTPLSGFSGNLNFSVSGLPLNAVASFTPNSLAGGGSSVVNIATSSSTPLGKYPLTFSVTGGAITHTAQALLVVATPPVSDFSISASPQSATIHSGQPANYELAISTVGGFSAPISLSCSGLPANSSCVFTPNPVQGSAATLQITTGGTTLALAPLPSNGIFFARVPAYGIFFATALAGFGTLGILFVVPRVRGNRNQNRRIISATGGIVLGLCLLEIGCGGGSASSTPANGSGGSSTPTTTATTTAGTYNITVLGTSGSLQHSTTVQLVVQ
jgi:hypothetical protein